jgi:hypothetical protein
VLARCLQKDSAVTRRHIGSVSVRTRVLIITHPSSNFSSPAALTCCLQTGKVVSGTYNGIQYTSTKFTTSAGTDT